MKSKTSIFIPSRMKSTRFPGKPLAPIDGIPMVIYCAKNALRTGLEVYVCTDSKEIEAICNVYNINCIITPECETGTDRIAHAVQQIETDYIINLQGDEPLIIASYLQKISSMIQNLKNSENIIISGVSPISSKEAYDKNNVKCSIIDNYTKIQYFSREPLLNSIKNNNKSSYYKQVGVYAMSTKVLEKFSKLPSGKLEKAEKVELLRWIENGYTVRCCLIENETISIDTPADLVKVISKINNN